MRALLRLAGAGLVLAAIAAAIIWWSLRPLAPMAQAQPGFRLANVTVIEPGIGRSEGRELVVEGDRIASLAAAGNDVDRYAGHFVLPGLVDMHVHFPPAALPGQDQLFAFLLLYHGVTSVRDAGDYDGTTTGAREGVRRSAFPGPRIFACGPFVDGDPPGQQNALVADSAESARAAVARVANEGYDCVKVYNQLGPQALAAIRDEAGKRGLPVIGHVPWRVPYEDARLDDVQHMTHVPGPPGEDTPYPQVMKGWLELDDARLDAVVEATREHGIANTPTLVASERRSHLDRYEELRQGRDAALLPRFFSDAIWSPVYGLPEVRWHTAEDSELLRAALVQMQDMVKRLHDEGAPLRTGTDVMVPFVVPGAALHRELRLFVGAGLSAEQALAVSTRDSAAALPVADLGRLTEGAPADLVVYRRDPTQTLDALDTIAAVAVGGRLYSREQLDEQLARYRGRFEQPVYDAILTTLVRRILSQRED